MRETKFRVWDKKRKKWADHIEIYHDGTFNISYFSQRDDCWWDADQIEYDGVVFDTKKDAVLMQYTGLKDKNGKEIYEGDILKWVAYGCPMDEYAELQATHRLVVKWMMGGFDIPYEDETHIVYEVIGNIYENPELLEKG